MIKYLLPLILFITTACSSSTNSTQKGNQMKSQDKIKVIFFDVNETTLDLNSMRKSVAKALQGREDLLPYWFSKMLHYSLVSNAIGNYQDFGKIGMNALLMVANENKIPLTETEAKEAIVGPLLSLPAHPDVEDALIELKKLGYKLVTLTNSSNFGVKTQLENAKLTQYFDERLSVEDIKIYKPQKEPYLWALEKMGVKPSEAILIAAHGWDVAGAKAAGLKAAFVARPGKSLYPLSIQPDYVVKDFTEFVEVMKKQ